MTRIILYFFPNMADMAHHNIVISRIRFIPNNIVYLLLTEYPAGILSEKLEDFKLCICKFLFFITFNNLSSLKIKNYIFVIHF